MGLKNSPKQREYWDASEIDKLKPVDDLSHQNRSTEFFYDEEEPLTPRSGKSLPNNEGIKPTKQPRKKSKQQKKPEKNERFQDVDRTGRWGSSITRTEMAIVAAVLVTIAVALIVLIALLASDGSSSSGPPPAAPLRTPAPTMAPSAGPEIDPNLQLEALLPMLRLNSFVNKTAFPSSPNDYLPYLNSPSSPSVLRAIAWILYDDPLDAAPDSPWLLQRYALAILYYELGGPSWTNTTGWMTARDTCSWYGVYCDRFNSKIIELDFNENNLQGQFPEAINLISTLVSLVLSNNRLNGEFPQLAVGTMPTLTRLFINNNQLTGRISTDVRKNGILTTFMAQHNSLTGSWRPFCPRSGQPEVFTQFGIDCDLISCQCCAPHNCF